MRFRRNTMPVKKRTLFKQSELHIKQKENTVPATAETDQTIEVQDTEPKTIKERVERKREKLKANTPPPNQPLVMDVLTASNANNHIINTIKLNQLLLAKVGFDRVNKLLELSPLPSIMLQEFDNKFKNQLSVENIASIMGLNDLRAVIKNKRIAMIANSTSLLNSLNGQEIDQYDIVVRFNSFVIIPEFTGTKTTIHASIYLQDVNFNVYVPIRVIIASSFLKWSAKIKTINVFNQGTFLGYWNQFDFIGYNLSLKPFTTGFNMFLLFNILGGFKELKLFGFDSYMNNDKSVMRSHLEKDVKISVVHDYNMEQFILQMRTKAFDKYKFNYVFV